MAKDRQEKSETDDAALDRYGEELLSANWNPVLELLEWSCARTAADAARNDKPAIDENDVNAFLTRVYTSGA